MTNRSADSVVTFKHPFAIGAHGLGDDSFRRVVGGAKDDGTGTIAEDDRGAASRVVVRHVL